MCNKQSNPDTSPHVREQSEGACTITVLTEKNTSHGEALAMLNSLAAWMDHAKSRTVIPLAKPVPPYTAGLFKGKTEEREQMLADITRVLRQARSRCRERLCLGK